MSKKILVIVKKYNVDGNNPYITNILVNEMRSMGDVVDVIALGDVDQNIYIKSDLGQDMCVMHRSNIRFLKYVLILREFYFGKVRKQVNIGEYDCAICIAPLTPLMPIYLSILKKQKRKICVVFDLFPFHQIQISALPARLKWLFAWTERMLLKKFDIVTGMSPANCRAISREYMIDSRKCRALRLWTMGKSLYTCDPTVYRRNCKMRKPIRVVFGGQITFGRSLPSAIKLLSLARACGLSIELSIYSSGNAFELLREKNSENWIVFKDRVSRVDYIRELENYNFGICVTDSRVTLPTFPSKILDYFSVNLPVICLIEQASDVGEVINSTDVFLVNNFVYSDEAVDELRNFLLGFDVEKTKQSFDEIDKRFSPEKAALRLARLINDIA